MTSTLSPELERTLMQLEAVWDPVGLLTASGLQFKRKSESQKNAQAFCIYHTETYPSLSVHCQKGIWQCLGCGEKGNLFKLLAQTWGIAEPYFWKVLVRLCEIYSVALPEKSADQDTAFPERALARYRTLAHETIWKHPEVLDYLASRRITSSVIKSHQIGYAARDMKILDGPHACRWVDALAAGLFTEYQPKKFSHVLKGRIVLPITLGRQVVNMTGRCFPENSSPRKYMNLPGRDKIPWGLDHVKAGETAVLVEGAFDGLISQEEGIPSVANLGSDAAQTSWLELLPLGSDLVLAFDADTAGAAATRQIGARLLESGIYVRVLDLPAGLDPASILAADGGPETWKALIAAAEPWVIWAVKRIGDAARLPARREQALHWILSPLARVPDPIYQYELIEALAAHLKFPAALAWRYLGSLVPPEVEAPGTQAKELSQ